MKQEAIWQSKKDNLTLSIYREENPSSPREWSNIGTMIYAHKRHILGDRTFQFGLYDTWEEALEGECGKLEDIVVLPLYIYDHSGVTMNTVGFNCRWDSGQVGWIYATKEKFRKETGYSEEELFGTDKTRKPKIGECVRPKGQHSLGKVIDIGNEFVLIDFDYNKALSFRSPQNTILFKINQVEVLTEKAKQILLDEVEIFDMYLRGDVYGYAIEQECHCSTCNNTSKDTIDSCWGLYVNDVDEMKEVLLSHLSKEHTDLISTLE